MSKHNSNQNTPEVVAEVPQDSTISEQTKVTVNPGDSLQDAVKRFKELKAKQVALKGEIKEAKEKHKAAILAAKGNNLSTTFTRMEATVHAINYGGTVETITDAADKKYAEMNPEKKQPRNIKEAQAVARFVFQTMSALGILSFNSENKQYQISDNFKTVMNSVKAVA